MIDGTLHDLIASTGDQDLRTALRKKRIKVVRHVPKPTIRHEDIMHRPGVVERYTAEQSKDIFKNTDYIFAFLREMAQTCCFVKGFRNLGLIDRLASSRDHRDAGEAAPLEYGLQELTAFKEFHNRLVIDWGESAISWHQKNLRKRILALKPPGFVRLMPAWNRVEIRFPELAAIVESPMGNQDWFEYLSNHDGVYLINHKPTNMMYVGIAYGEKEGLWGRWKGYVRTIHNRNKDLVAFCRMNPDGHHDFYFSILETFPKGTSEPAIRDAERFFQGLLGTREFGFNGERNQQVLA